jgi:hypothetical protein
LLLIWWLANPLSVNAGDKVVARTLFQAWIAACGIVLRKHLHKHRYAFLSQRICGSVRRFGDAKYLSRLEKTRYFT